MSTSGEFRIKPAGRHLLTIGRDLIKDVYAAVVELVKNAYDADSPDVHIEFRAKTDLTGHTITVSDHGHGMTRDTVVNKWMVPSTPDKLNRRESPQGRIMQGRKGVGRYATSVLGTDLLLETVTSEGEKTTVYVEWKNFESAEYLDDVEVLVETIDTTDLPGTRLTINGNEEDLAEWNQKQFDRLRFELKKLKPPVKPVSGNDDFVINLSICGFPDVDEIGKEAIERYPILDLFDYRISGEIFPDGKGTLTYSLQKARNAPEEIIPFDFEESTGCGRLMLDIRVYDRDKDAIDSLIERGLKGASGRYVTNLEARQLLNEYNGIGVYRNGFRIRPLGDADFDWLKLNEQRIQNPSLRIGSNQAIGYVEIQSEEKSGLIEKSARDGIKENVAFEQLRNVAKKVIAELEVRRFDYRRKTGLNRPVLKLERELEQLFSYDQMKRHIRTALNKAETNEETTEKIMGIIDRDQTSRIKIIDDIRNAVAVYQGQATLGKIINVILHEGRQPLHYFRNQIPNIRRWHDSIYKEKTLDKLNKIIPAVNGMGDQADLLVDLFNRLDPLAARRRSKREFLKLKKAIEDILSIFSKEMKSCKVTAAVTGPDDFQFSCWPQDIHAIFTNLIGNSIYWLTEKKSHGSKRKITIDLLTDEESLLHVDYRDTGPGIEPSLIESGVIFEPQFSTKPSGTGLGLAIAGEAAARNGLELKAYESDRGACFRLQPKLKNEE